ncbi:protein FAR1-RELATED SEQUENCE 5-like [Salvia miltiorrhiza]|uniref:protein FAR1-RELATED SEQUENCE 5-like n=1 Tax=Salvia miltiorrhiza TaxID=226208 RepID=UPI0025AC0401|nr:protein FAR1-RELATED SEQUENCE 5-like [Salvia miltiorrhiza]XP_057809154.1 protein FAR1-RELATED SEQUENCE 5-like [Salvia miltiorrhiza]
MSESENSFFKRHLNKHASLSELYVLFETAIETQRHDHDALTLADETSFPELITILDIEKHAATVYTNTIFLEVQKEIQYASAFCTIPKCIDDTEGHIYDVDEDAEGIFKVHHNIVDDYLSCSCKFFVRNGLLCKHMIAVARNLKLKTIPEKYIVYRWTRNASSIFKQVGQNRFGSSTNNCEANTDGLVSLALNCIGLVDGNVEAIQSLRKMLQDFLDEQSKKSCNASSSSFKERLIENFYGSSLPSVVTVFPPDVAKTKGSCSRKKSRLEAEAKRAQKPKRLCKKCNTLGYHDSRNCDKVNAKNKNVSDSDI